MGLQLFLMKRGGQEIYVGPLGHHSRHLIKYFEVECNGQQKKRKNIFQLQILVRVAEL
jgi:hypothetical protein